MGEPAWSNVHALPPEYIGRVETTGGTETSKYLEEKKSTEIPLVVASERGGGQTGGFILRGSDLHHDQRSLKERHGKAGRRG